MTHDEKLQLIQWCVELRSNREIVGLIDEKFNKTLNQSMVWKYRHCKKWKPVIERLRKQFEKNLCKIPIANKADRIRFLQTVVSEGLKWSLKSYDKFGNPIYELKLGAVTEAIKAAREEVEGKTPLIDNSTHLHLTNLQGENLIKEARRRNIPLPDELERKIDVDSALTI